MVVAVCTGTGAGYRGVFKISTVEEVLYYSTIGHSKEYNTIKY